MTWEILIYTVVYCSVYAVTFFFALELWDRLDLDEKLSDLDLKLTMLSKRIFSSVRKHFRGIK